MDTSTEKITDWCVECQKITKHSTEKFDQEYNGIKKELVVKKNCLTCGF